MSAPAVAINGFGRIGRLVLRAFVERGASVNIVAVNDVADAKELGYLLEHDSVHGRFPGSVRVGDGGMTVNGDRFEVLSEKDPAALPWRELGVDYVVEATGKFRTREALQAHLDAGARRILLTAPGKGVDLTVVRGINLDAYDPAQHRVVSNASCTTNCLAPVLKVLDDAFGVERAAMTTVHAYTNGQRLLDAPGKDARRSRSAGQNIIPTTTGAAEAIGEVLPRLRGKVTGLAIRVPVPNVSLIDLNATLARPTTREALERAFVEAAAGPLDGILGAERAPLVSSDFNHDARSAVVDLPTLTVVDGTLVKVLAWYDNEWAYAMRCAEAILHMASRDERAAGEIRGARAPA